MKRITFIRNKTQSLSIRRYIGPGMVLCVMCGNVETQPIDKAFSSLYIEEVRTRPKIRKYDYHWSCFSAFLSDKAKVMDEWLERHPKSKQRLVLELAS
jgi:hypothetical protein